MEVTLSVLVLAALAVVVASAPAMQEGPGAMDQEKLLKEFYRDRRSQYPQYVTPCAAAAASAPIPSIAPSAYQVNLSPYHPYPAPASHSSYYGMPQAPHYRSFEFEPEQEVMSYSDMDHMMSEHIPMARYGYAVPPPPAHPPVYAPAPPVASGPAVGVFPNAKLGGCSVPLLFSCAPSIVPGHVVPGASPGYGNAYRGVEAMAHHEAQENHEEPTVTDHMAPVHEPSHTNQKLVHK